MGGSFHIPIWPCGWPLASHMCDIWQVERKTVFIVKLFLRLLGLFFLNYSGLVLKFPKYLTQFILNGNKGFSAQGFRIL